MHEINRNFPWCDEHSDKSFLGILHEEGKWSDEEYFKLENNLHELSIKYKDSENLPREVAWRVMRIFSCSMHYLGCHFDSNDGFVIRGLNRKEIYERRERLELMFEGFFQGTMPKDESFEYTNSVN